METRGDNLTGQQTHTNNKGMSFLKVMKHIHLKLSEKICNYLLFYILDKEYYYLVLNNTC